MRSSPGFLNVLQEQMERLPFELLEEVNKPGGLEIRDLLDFLTNPKDYTVHEPYQTEETSIKKNSDISIDAFWIGKNSLLIGETAHCIIVEESSFACVPDSQVTLLELQLMKVSWVKHVWLLVSPHEKDRALKCAAAVGKNVNVIENYQTFCLTPDNRLHVNGVELQLISCGSGDLLESLKHCDFFNSFKKEGGKYIVACGGDNVLGCAHPVILGQHILEKKPVTIEVTIKKQNDTQHTLCEHAGFNQLVENFRFSSHTDVHQFKLMSTGTYIFDVDMDWDSVKWKWHRLKKIKDNKVLVQYARTLCDLTAAFQTQIIETPRHYCYMTLKDYEKK